MPEPSRASRLAAHLGTGIGFFGWVIGLGIALGVSGDGAAALRVLPAATLLSAALWLVTLVAVEGTRHAFGARSREANLTLFGCLLAAVGILAIVLQHWILPDVLQTGATGRALERTGSITSVPLLWRLPPLAAGVALLAWPAWRLATAPPGRTPAAQDQS